MPEIAMFCRKCRRALDRLSVDGRLQYLHTSKQVAEGPIDHSPDPAPIDQIENPIQVCDFCSDHSAVWAYLSADQVTDGRIITAKKVGIGDYQRRHHAARTLGVETEKVIGMGWGERWATCEPCAAFVEAKDIYGLLGRVIDLMPRKLVSGKKLLRRRGELFDLYSTFFNTLQPGRGRIVPGHPYGLWTGLEEESND